MAGNSQTDQEALSLSQEIQSSDTRKINPFEGSGVQDQCTKHGLISKGPRNVSLSTRERFPESKERNGDYDRGPLHHIVSCDIEARGRISTVPPPRTRSVSGGKVRSQDKGVDIFRGE